MNIYDSVFVVFLLLEFYLIIRAFLEWYFDAALNQFGKRIEVQVSDCERRSMRPDEYAYYIRYDTLSIASIMKVSSASVGRTFSASIRAHLYQSAIFLSIPTSPD